MKLNVRAVCQPYRSHTHTKAIGIVSRYPSDRYTSPWLNDVSLSMGTNRPASKMPPMSCSHFIEG